MYKDCGITLQEQDAKSTVAAIGGTKSDPEPVLLTTRTSNKPFYASKQEMNNLNECHLPSANIMEQFILKHFEKRFKTQFNDYDHCKSLFK